MPPIRNRRKNLPHHKKTKNNQTSRGLVRIIAGTHRGRRLPVLVHEGLRPTGDRVKESLFNWLMNNVSGAVCLDMYAGSGSLGIEALSRGASHAVFIEQDKKVCEQITQNLVTLREQNKASVIQKSALTFDSQNELNSIEGFAGFNLVFIDPPFNNNLINKSLALLFEQNLLASEALIYIETGHNDEYQIPAELSTLKELKTSQVNARLLKYSRQ